MKKGFTATATTATTMYTSMYMLFCAPLFNTLRENA